MFQTSGVDSWQEIIHNLVQFYCYVQKQFFWKDTVHPFYPLIYSLNCYWITPLCQRLVCRSFSVTIVESFFPIFNEIYKPVSHKLIIFGWITMSQALYYVLQRLLWNSHSKTLSGYYVLHTFSCSWSWQVEI
jgi:hypothetical protein